MPKFFYNFRLAVYYVAGDVALTEHFVCMNTQRHNKYTIDYKDIQCLIPTLMFKKRPVLTCRTNVFCISGNLDI